MADGASSMRRDVLNVLTNGRAFGEIQRFPSANSSWEARRRRADSGDIGLTIYCFSDLPA